MRLFVYLLALLTGFSATQSADARVNAAAVDAAEAISASPAFAVEAESDAAILVQLVTEQRSILATAAFIDLACTAPVSVNLRADRALE